MEVLRAVRAEWPLLRIRLLRTRLGPWLALIVLALLWLEHAAPAADPLTTILLAGALSAVLCVGYLAGSAADRAALLLPLMHPGSAAALVVGRWVAAMGGAALVVLGVAGHSAWTTGVVAASLDGALAGLATAAAVGACTFVLVLAGGNVLAALYFAWLALAGSAPPESFIGSPHPGPIRLALAAMAELTPGPWRYRAIAAGDPGALSHAMVWMTFGLTAACRMMGRLRESLR